MNSPADRVLALYEAHALDWDTDRRAGIRSDGSPAEKEWLDHFASLLPPGASILDVGCGAGVPIARYFLEQGFEMTGIDASPTMIELCRSRFPRASWSIADMRRLELGRTFHGLIAWDSFFHLDHDFQRRMFPIFARHAAPNAALMLTSGISHGVAIGAFHDAPLYHGSLAPDEYRSLLSTSGFIVRAHIQADPRCGRRTVWLAQHDG